MSMSIEQVEIASAGSHSGTQTVSVPAEGRPGVLPVTQYDDCLLPNSHGLGERFETIPGNGATRILSDGTQLTAMTQGGSSPRLHLWKNDQSIAQIPLHGEPGASIILANGDATSVLFCSDSRLMLLQNLESSPEAVSTNGRPVLGTLVSAAVDEEGNAWALLSRGGPLDLVQIQPWSENAFASATVVKTGFSATVGHLMYHESNWHFAYEDKHGIEYKRFDVEAFKTAIDTGQPPKASHEERAAEGYGFAPTLSIAGDTLLLAYLGESCREPGSPVHHVSWQRLGRGGYVACLARSLSNEQGDWQRYQLADSKQIVLRHRPIGECYGGGPNDALITRIETFSPPSITIDRDGVPQVYWANQTRRWVYVSRFLGMQDGFTPAAEVFGPLERLTGPIFTAASQQSTTDDGHPLIIRTADRLYRCTLAQPERNINDGAVIDFLQPDMLSGTSGLELQISQMHRHAQNPVIPKGKPGDIDDGGVVADIFQLDDGGWQAVLKTRMIGSNANEFAESCGAVSSDGITWEKTINQIDDRYQVEGVGNLRYSLRYIEDASEPNPEFRFKGFCRVEDLGPWAWAVIVSADGKKWKRVDTPCVVRADDDLRLRDDQWDDPSRRFKACAIGRSYCGRVCVMWTSADGIHWNECRDTLDLEAPFTASSEPGGTGRIIVDSWAGPDEEDELHGGYLFRDGDRWLCHYMKWTADGHIYCGLASSRDGLNFSRVAGGQSTLPLGGAGTWDAGRVAIREAPFLVGNTWRQYYTGSGWKHGLGGIGAKTSPFGVNSPTQIGLAELPAGRWTSLRLKRDEYDGTLTSTSIKLCEPHDLTVNISGLATPMADLQVELQDERGKPIDGFSFADCNTIQSDGLMVPVTWSNRTISELVGRTIRLHASIKGHGLRLYGFKFTPLKKQQ